MPDLVIQLRQPLLPDTHVEGWVRFETKNVKYEFSGCEIHIQAVDAIGKHHKINTDHLKIMRVEGHHYATRDPEPLQHPLVRR
jgi:hypothetical protein